MQAPIGTRHRGSTSRIFRCVCGESGIVRLLLVSRAASIRIFFFFSSRRRHTRLQGDWSSDVCSSDLVAPGAKLIGLGTGDILFIFWALAGFDYILDHQQAYNIKVVNNSWGTSGPFDPKDPINKATKKVHDKGITVVFAAGNDGPDQNTLNPYSVAPWVIGVRSEERRVGKE